MKDLHLKLKFAGSVAAVGLYAAAKAVEHGGCYLATLALTQHAYKPYVSPFLEGPLQSPVDGVMLTLMPIAFFVGGLKTPYYAFQATKSTAQAIYNVPMQAVDKLNAGARAVGSYFKPAAASTAPTKGNDPQGPDAAP
ncbi:MAG: hypothetical protein LRZ85_08375 [Alphaproteobacteria bacterium]|nr:hypothetical protein [Alphaproteobacteria bacterium]MCD8525657.1 hypothetical protein [Alphaproteobacteria bacterium]MCD8570033.1 hypothetical protein [Alphaproteobacteria bacterium]